MMKKNLIKGFLLLALCGTTAVSVTSCKDTEDDLYTELAGDQVALEAQLDKLAAQLSECKANCQQQITALQQQIAALQAALNTTDGKFNSYYTKTEIDQKFADLENLYVKLTQITGWKEAIDAIKASGIDKLDKATVDALVALAGIKGDLSDIAAWKNDLEKVKALANNVAALNELAAKKDDLLALLNAEPIVVPDLTDLNNAVFGTPDADGNLKGGLLDRVSGLEGYFKLEDGTVISVADFQKALANGQWLTSYMTAIEDMYNHLKDADGNVNTDALDALMKYYTKFDKLNSIATTIFPGVKENEDGTIEIPEDAKFDQWWNYDEVINAIITNQEAIEALEGQLSYLLQRFNDMVTSLVLQSTENPVFGGFNTPFGFNSMVLMTYYGQASSDVNFPFESSEDASDYKGNVFASLSGVTGENFGGTLYNNSLGKLYFTVNPVGANVNADGFSIENSAEVKAPVKVVAVPSSAELRFGIGGRSETNGFYEADVTLDATPATAQASLDAIKIHITDGLVDALKDVYRAKNLTSVAGLAKTVYNCVSDMCTANALRYDWTVDNNGTAENYSVLSQYGMAVTSFKPLSFTTMRDVNISRRLPIFGRNIEIPKDKAQLNISVTLPDDFKFDFQLNIGEITFNQIGDKLVTVKVPAKFDVRETATGEKETYLPDGWENKPEYYTTVTVNLKDDLNAVIAEMQKSVDEWLKGNGTETNPGLQAQINNSLNNAINDAFYGEDGFITKIQDEIDSQIGKVQDKINDLIDRVNGSRYLSYLNKMIRKYDSLAKKVNERIDDPNQYLQVSMFYETSGGGMNFLSNDGNGYSLFQYNGGDGINLWATTYNFETIAPVYRKFVAVTSVKEDGVEKPELIAAANAAGNMATVVNGDGKAFTLTTKNVVTPGHSYAFEITYRALDYQGHTSTGRYFLVVDAR